ncbi:MAG: tetratricopeptide repeat protein [Caldisericia bacterium]|nr:tetratricopeptide repeat protein [Caldisericia bacterium]
MPVNTISLCDFFYHFCKDAKPVKNFCFILGAGASIQSGIPGAHDLAGKWLKEIKDINEQDYTQWIQDNGVDIRTPETHYTTIFDQRFKTDIQVGYHFLQSIMEGKEPSCGYSILAQILAEKDDNVVITTNFDCLTEDAMFLYSTKRPIVIGHEYLAEFIKANLSCPLIIKIHRDLHLAPKNSTKDTAEMDKSVSKQLSHILRTYTPIVIGYGANDGSLINFLHNLEKDDINGGMFWCTRNPKKLTKKIVRVVEKFKGFAMKIEGFDEFMIQLGDELDFPRLDEIILKTAEKRAKNYRNQIEIIKRKLKPSSDIDKALTNIVNRGEKDWWTYELMVQSEPDNDKKEIIHQEGLREIQNNPYLMGSYANFLCDIRKDYNRAEEYYKKALELNPKNSDNLGNYANFLCHIRKDYDRAEEYYKKALELDPKNSDHYASIIPVVQKNRSTSPLQ